MPVAVTSTRPVTQPDRRPAAPSPEELIRLQVMAARLACKQITEPTLQLLLDSVERACCLPTRPGWERKAAAHAEIFHLLVGVAGGPAAAARHGALARLIRDLICSVGPAANGMITSSRWRLI